LQDFSARDDVLSTVQDLRQSIYEADKRISSKDKANEQLQNKLMIRESEILSLKMQLEALRKQTLGESVKDLQKPWGRFFVETAVCTLMLAVWGTILIGLVNNNISYV